MTLFYATTTLLAGSLALNASASALIDYSFDSNAGNDIGPAVQVLENNTDSVTAGSANTLTGLISSGVGSPNIHNHAIGFNSSGLVDLSSYAGFTATFEVDSIAISSGRSLDALTGNGIFFGVVSGSNATGTAGTSLFNSSPSAIGYVPGKSDNFTRHTILEKDGATKVVTGATTTVPDDESVLDGFTLSISVFADNTWQISSTGLSTELNQTGSLTNIDYATFASGVGLYTTFQGAQLSTLDMNRMTLTAVPEPGSLALLGLGGLLIVRRRRN